MKFFNRACLVIFSLIILVITTTIILMSLGVLETKLFTVILTALISAKT